MAQGKKISELTEVSSVTDNDEFLFVDKEGSGSDSGVGGKTAKIKFSNLKASFGDIGKQGDKGEKGQMESSWFRRNRNTILDTKSNRRKQHFL